MRNFAPYENFPLYGNLSWHTAGFVTVDFYMSVISQI